ncbi:hypothetical protein PUNSTDRAFT_138333 [Punctularia strigosozonata HHB-11173 SS5]|uniref:Uncharacterized protein n=1 Tax=Punctularia strigosozonata (strain HHB-11173) TaxID=741275 RepID=R7S387_PUNST|nr:uncharacterized protein PUNSTDRAFT_138333 [Punctularia strigosozonata HHB-11173 SS5]EIN04688.1 hypothetical protein PUNSTDRAFT_138333 [Punctularia strigosozonata HHB-11173 SS5]
MVFCSKCEFEGTIEFVEAHIAIAHRESKAYIHPMAVRPMDVTKTAAPSCAPSFPSKTAPTPGPSSFHLTTPAEQIVLPPCSSIFDPALWCPPPPGPVAPVAPIRKLSCDAASREFREILVRLFPSIFAHGGQEDPAYGPGQNASHYRTHTGA